MKHKTFKTKPLKAKHLRELNYSQAKVAGFDLKKFQEANVAVIGGGAIGSHVCLGLVRKGMGLLDIFDDDNVEVQNLTRQLFSPKDLKKNKAQCLAKILSMQGYFNSTITGYPLRFQEGLEAGFDYAKYDVIICGVDNNPTRIAVAKFCVDHSLPLIMSAISRDANQLYCAIQEPGKACFACIQPNAVDDSTYPCDLPAAIDIVQVIAGLTVFAVDTILLKRHREWNLRTLTLDGFMPDTGRVIPKRKDCPICGSKASS